MSNPTIQFKRLAVGMRFSTAQGTFRKVTNKGAYRVLDTGTSATHKIIPFSRSCAVASC